MAIIICPECGKEMSDTLSACPHCGFQINENGSIQKVEVVENEVKKKKRLKAIKLGGIIAIAVVLVISLGLITKVIINKTNEKREEKKQVEEQARKEKEEEEYYNKYKTVYITMLTSAASCEKITGTVYNVWHDSIYNNGADDFNTNITCLYTGESYKKAYADGNDLITRFGMTEDLINSFRDMVQSVKDVDTTLTNGMKELNSPPEKYNESYKELVSLYGIYQGLSAQAKSPTGNLQSFNTDVEDKKSAFIVQYKKIQVLLPDLNS